MSNDAHDDPTEDMHPLNTEARIAVMSVQIAHIGKTLDRIEQGSTHTVPRAEWEQRNAYVDLRLLDAFAQISKVNIDATAGITKINAEIASRRAPWWSVVAAGGAALAIIAYLFNIIPSIVN